MKEKSNHAAVASLMKKFAKSLGITKVSSKSDSYSGGSSVNVYVEDLPPKLVEKLEAESHRYEYGHFNGMEDIYEYNDDRDESVPHVSYVFIKNEISDAMRDRIYAFARGYYSKWKELPESYDEARNIRAESHNAWVNDVVYRLFSGYFEDFWKEVESEKVAA